MPAARECRAPYTFFYPFSGLLQGFSSVAVFDVGQNGTTSVLVAPKRPGISVGEEDDHRRSRLATTRQVTEAFRVTSAFSTQMNDELSFNEDWEEWDRQDNFLHHMVAGSIAGITEHTVMYPVDTFKTYVQCMRECPEAVAGRRVMEMVRGQGLLRLWRGVGTMFAGCVPAHALYFSVLEHCKVCGCVSEVYRRARGGEAGEEAGNLSNLKFHKRHLLTSTGVQ